MLNERLGYVMCSEDSRRIIDISSLFASKNPEAITKLLIPPSKEN
jgi:hypothetical protein